MKKSKYLQILICTIAFTLVSCAEIPACENSIRSEDNMLFLGIYHAIILPLAVLGKLVGINIGLYSVNGNFTYWAGYFAGIIGYARFLLFLGAAWKETKSY